MTKLIDIDIIPEGDLLVASDALEEKGLGLVATFLRLLSKNIHHPLISPGIPHYYLTQQELFRITNLFAPPRLDGSLDMERARMIELLSSEYGTPDKIADFLGIKESELREYAYLLQLWPADQQKVSAGELSRALAIRKLKANGVQHWLG